MWGRGGPAWLVSFHGVSCCMQTSHTGQDSDTTWNTSRKLVAGTHRDRRKAAQLPLSGSEEVMSHRFTKKNLPESKPMTPTPAAASIAGSVLPIARAEE